MALACQLCCSNGFTQATSITLKNWVEKKLLNKFLKNKGETNPYSEAVKSDLKTKGKYRLLVDETLIQMQKNQELIYSSMFH